MPDAAADGTGFGATGVAKLGDGTVTVAGGVGVTPFPETSVAGTRPIKRLLSDTWGPPGQSKQTPQARTLRFSGNGRTRRITWCARAAQLGRELTIASRQL